METYEYDRDNAEKAFEYMKYQRAKYLLGATCGTVALYWARPFQRRAEEYSLLFKKPWMKLPIYAFAFTCAFYGGIQLPSRIFYKFSPSKNEGVSHAVYSSSQDMVSKFRMFETFDTVDSRDNIASYL